MNCGWICPICGITINPNLTTCPNLCNNDIQKLNVHDYNNYGNYITETYEITVKVEDGYLITKTTKKDYMGNVVLMEEKKEPISSFFPGFTGFPLYNPTVYYPNTTYRYTTQGGTGDTNMPDCNIEGEI